MSKKERRSISSFGQVASNIDINNKSNIENNNNDIIKSLVKENIPKDKTHTFKGYYLENEVANTIDRLSEGKHKGFKSDLVNEIIKKFFQKEGLL